MLIPGMMQKKKPGIKHSYSLFGFTDHSGAHKILLLKHDSL